MTVELSPGDYFAAIPSGTWPRIWIRIVIEAGKVTEADVTKLRW